VSEHHARTELHQPFRLGSLRGRFGDPEQLCRPPDKRRVPHGIGGSHQQQAPRITWKAGQPPGEALFDACRQRHRRRKTEPARELRRGQPARQLEQSERVSACLEDEPVEHALVERDRQHRLQERPSIAIPQGPNAELWQSREGIAKLPCRERDRDPLCQQAAGNKRKH
jgi:hypothetical protein